jgi:site-specific recombinase XerD
MNGKSRNLTFQIDRLFKLNNMKSLKTRYRYRDACYRFCNWLGENTNVKKFKNIKVKHIYMYTDFMRAKNYAPGTIKLELSGIRFFYTISEGKEVLPTNEKLKLENRVNMGAKRAWTQEEIDKAINLAKDMGRIDVVKAIILTSKFGCRLEEAVVLTTHQIKEAICSGFLYLENTKENNPREIPVKAENVEALRYILANAKSSERIFIGVGNKTHKVKKSIQNWVINHRKEFQDVDRIDRDTAREMLQKDRAAAPKTNLTMHGNRHTYAQSTFKELSENYTVKGAKKRLSGDMGHYRPEISNVYLH